jgi:hypothetical protein
MRKTIALLAMIAMIGLSSCKKESSDPAICNLDWDTETETEYDALVTAYTTYAGNMTVANCNAYKSAFTTYINALKPFLECESWSEADKQELQGVIDQAEATMNQLNCQ